MPPVPAARSEPRRGPRRAAIDGVDNGVSQWDNGDTPPRYVSKTDLSSRVSNLNPRWNQPETPSHFDAAFARAVALTGAEFMEALDYTSAAWLPARQYVAQALAGRFEVHPSGGVLQLPRFCPWKEHLYELEEEAGTRLGPLPVYCLYPDSGGQWRIQAIPVNPSSFDSRKALPEPWRGLRDGELSGVAGVAGCVFVHASGFIGGNATVEGAREMAVKALAM